jgi:alpha-tubulin suppressor-like RCC1 family protein
MMYGSQLVRCSRCGAANKTGARFCVRCGEALRVRTCPHCSELISQLDARFCRHCGGRLEVEAPAPFAAPEAGAHPPELPGEGEGPMAPPAGSSASLGVCPHCGGVVGAGARFCRHCGRGLVGRPSRRWWVAVGVLAFGLVGVGIWGWLSFFGHRGRATVVAGEGYSFALADSGEVYAWGNNEFGQLGLGDKEDRLTPTKVPGLTGVKAIIAGGGHFFALTESGEVYAWGWNEAGQLGLGDTENRLTPTKVPGLTGVKAIAIIAGGLYSLALTESGEVYAWGQNRGGQLGLGDTKDRLTPTKVPGLSGIKAIAAGWDHSFALTDSGEVYAWGDNICGQLGLGDTENRLTPTKVPGLTGVKAIVAEAWPSEDQIVGHSLALTEAGEVYAWGWNEAGQLGLGDTNNRLTPTKVPGLTGVKAIAIIAGGGHSLALTESGEVYAWGQNKDGELGLGDTNNRLTPTKVPGLTLAQLGSVGDQSRRLFQVTYREDVSYGRLLPWEAQDADRRGRFKVAYQRYPPG